MNIKNKQATDLSMHFQGAIETTMVAAILIDNDLIVNYINQATLNLLKEYEKTLQRRWSKFKANEKSILGSSIEALYKELNTSNNSFSDPSTPYWTTEINIEGLTFNASVSRVFDEKGGTLNDPVALKNIKNTQGKMIETL